MLVPDAANSVEQRDIDGRSVFLAGLALAALIALSIAMLWLIYGAAQRPLPFGAGMEPLQQKGPMLQTDPRGDRLEYEAEKRTTLNNLGWIDRHVGIAHIPINDAMRLVAARGEPDWGQTRALTADACRLIAFGVPRAPQAKLCYRGLED